MSLVPTIVLAKDGHYYKDPVLKGVQVYDGFEHLWFICFDDEDPPELVISHRQALSRNDMEELAKMILINNHIKADFLLNSVYRNWQRMGRCFRLRTIKPAFNVYLEIKEPIPKPNVPVNPVQKLPSECTVYSFGNEPPF